MRGRGRSTRSSRQSDRQVTPAQSDRRVPLVRQTSIRQSIDRQPSSHISGSTSIYTRGLTGRTPETTDMEENE